MKTGGEKRGSILAIFDIWQFSYFDLSEIEKVLSSPELFLMFQGTPSHSINMTSPKGYFQNWECCILSPFPRHLFQNSHLLISEPLLPEQYQTVGRVN